VRSANLHDGPCGRTGPSGPGADFVDGMDLVDETAPVTLMLQGLQGP
jgi:hypothetical protein